MSDQPNVKNHVSQILSEALLEDAGAAPDPAVVRLLHEQGLSDEQIRSFLGLTPDHPL